MKFFAKLLLVLIVLAVMLPFTFLRDENGNTLLSFSDLKMPDLSMPDISSLGAVDPSGNAGGTDRFYKWFDADGNIQFTSEPPPEGIELSVKEIDPNTNLIQAVKAPEAETAGSAEVEESSKTEKTGTNINPYSKESVEKLYEDAHNVEKLLKQ